MSMRCTISVAFVVMLLNAAISWAEPTPTAFPKGTITLQAYSTYAAGLDDTGAELGAGNAGVGYFVWDNVSMSLEANAYATREGDRSGTAYGVSGVLRQHLLAFDKFTLFADVSFGPIEDTVRIPSGGTYFNFATRSGLGLTYHLHDHLYLMGGVRYFHLSNARIDGPARNPSINGIEGVLGVMWTL